MARNTNRLPEDVAQRLEVLRRLYVAESDEAARDRLIRERPTPAAPVFAVAVQARLQELRALCELTRHLHAGKPRRSDASQS